MPVYKNTKFLISILIVIFGRLSYANAQTDFIIPQSGYSLKLQKKKELIFSSGGYIKRDKPLTYNFQFQVGYSPIKHLGVSLFLNRQRLSIPEIASIHNNFISGINLGTYFTIRKVHFDISSGYSIGRLKTKYDIYTHPVFLYTLGESFFDINLQKFYFQGGIHSMFFDFIHLSGIYRIGKLDYKRGILQGQSFRGSESNLVQIINQRYHLFNEIAIKLEVIREPIALYVQITQSNIKTFTSSSYLREIGLTFDIGKLKSFFSKRKKQRKFKNKND